MKRGTYTHHGILWPHTSIRYIGAFSRPANTARDGAKPEAISMTAPVVMPQGNLIKVVWTWLGWGGGAFCFRFAASQGLDQSIRNPQQTGKPEPINMVAPVAMSGDRMQFVMPAKVRSDLLSPCACSRRGLG